jgi:CDP-diacylglycerol--serine O-phosphatidyltransferase
VLKEKYRFSANRGIYLLPNLLTTAALFAGFYAVVAAMNGYFEVAAIAIFVAMVMDSLDGRVARLTQTTTPFGSEYDSLSDMVSFGVAPSLVIYQWVLSLLGKFGWLCAFIFTACVALRLARFNTQIEVADKRYFQGLPSPPAAGLLAGVVWAGADYFEPSKFVAFIAALLTLLAAILMVSNIRYHSFKKIDLRGKIRFVSVIFIVLGFALVSIDPPWILFSLFFGYAASGPALTIYNLRQARLLRKRGLKQTITKEANGI